MIEVYGHTGEGRRRSQPSPAAIPYRSEDPKKLPEPHSPSQPTAATPWMEVTGSRPFSRLKPPI